MKKYLLAGGCMLAALGTQAQVGITYHNSYDNFLGVNYEFRNGLLPEFRLHTNRDLKDVDAELGLSFLILRKEEFQFYAGVGIMVLPPHDGVRLLAPVGLNFYPFTRKNFGFHIEAAPMTDGERSHRLRTSWGIRYRFAKR